MEVREDQVVEEEDLISDGRKSGGKKSNQKVSLFIVFFERELEVFRLSSFEAEASLTASSSDLTPASARGSYSRTRYGKSYSNQCLQNQFAQRKLDAESRW